MTCIYIFNRQFEQWQGERQHVAQQSHQRFLYPTNEAAEVDVDPLGQLPAVSIN